MNELPRTVLGQGIAGDFQQLSAGYLLEYGDKIRIAVTPLTVEQVWWRPNPEFNSVGNLLLHLTGEIFTVVKVHQGHDRSGTPFAEVYDHCLGRLYLSFAAWMSRNPSRLSLLPDRMQLAPFPLWYFALRS